MKVKPSPFLPMSPTSNYSKVSNVSAQRRHSKTSTEKYDVVALNKEYDIDPIITRMDQTAKVTAAYQKDEL